MLGSLSWTQFRPTGVGWPDAKFCSQILWLSGMQVNGWQSNSKDCSQWWEFLLYWCWPICFGSNTFCKNSVEYSSSRLSEFHNSSLYITKSSLNVCVYKYIYVYVCMLLMLLKLFQLDSHSNVIFICNTKGIKLFWTLVPPCAWGKEPSLYPIICGSVSWCFENRILNTRR